MSEIDINKPREQDISIVMVTPGMNPESLTELASRKEIKAIVLVAYATGTTPQTLNEAIQEVTRKGIPVFLLSNNPADPAGILNDISYMTQAKSKEAGAIALQKVNIKHIQQVLDAIQAEIDTKKKGAELGEAIRVKYAYVPGEEKPKPDWEIPAKIAEQRTLLGHTLRRIGTPEDEIEKVLDQWEGKEI